MATKARLRSARPRAPLTRAKVLRAALRTADKHGLEALSMRTLASSLHVEAMSLYNHVRGKEDLLDGLVELVVEEIELPAQGGDWREAMRRRARSAYEALTRHPWATMLLVSRINVGPAMLRYVDATVGCLRAAGFSYALADHAWNALDAYLYGFALQQRHFPLEPAEYASAAASFLPMIPPETHPHMHGLTQEVIAGRHDGLHSLDFGLDLLLDGLDARRLAERTPPSPPRAR